MRGMLCISAALALAAAVAASDDASVRDKLDAAKRKTVSDAEKVTLRYKFTAGEQIRWTTEHLASTETTIRGNTQTSQSRSISTKLWTIKEATPDGGATIVHSVEEVEMWQKVSGRPEVRYNSRTDKTPPAGHERVAETIGVPLATVTVSAHGAILKRDGAEGARTFGLGDFIMPLPERPIAIGERWHAPNEIMVRLPEGEVKRIAIRKQFTLKSLSAGVAKIDVETQVLTPVDDAKVKSQLMQQLTQGEIKFDIDAGRVIGSQIDWDERVIGFNGPDSSMKYLARFTEQMKKTDPSTARK